MNVRDLIDALRLMPADDSLCIACSPISLTPVEAGSYRGFYEDLSIHVEPSRGASPMTAGKFATYLESLIGTDMRGYKGGTYPILDRTRVWISNYGECSGARVVGVHRENWGCTFIDWKEEA